MDLNSERIGFGGGCHWCTEAIFQALRSVSRVEQGFIRSTPPHETFSEAVIVRFDPDALPLDVLVEVHLRTHSSTSRHKLRGKYRSAVYVFDPGQAERAREAIARLQPGFDAPLVTEVLPFVAFRPSEPRYQNYYAADPQRPFCRTYIEPKLAELRRRFATEARPRSVS